ncbi:hypothetical protein ACLOJK_011947 [Asimina triloba]
MAAEISCLQAAMPRPFGAVAQQHHHNATPAASLRPAHLLRNLHLFSIQPLILSFRILTSVAVSFSRIADVRRRLRVCDGDALDLNPVLLVSGMGGSILNARSKKSRLELRAWVRIFLANLEFKKCLWSVYNPKTGSVSFSFRIHPALDPCVGYHLQEFG